MRCSTWPACSTTPDWFSPIPGVCFTAVGARAALSSGERAQAPRRSAEQAAEAIAMHLWPGARPDRHGPETSYLVAGAALDIVGLRIWDLDPAPVEQVLTRWPRAGFVDDFVRRWRAECAAVPGGRADFLRRYGGFLLAARLAPFLDPNRGVRVAAR